MELDDFEPKYALNVYEHEARAICKLEGMLAQWKPRTDFERFWGINKGTVSLYIYNNLTNQHKVMLKLYLGFDAG